MRANGWSVFDILSGARAEGWSLRHASPRSACYYNKHRPLLARKYASPWHLAAAECFLAMTRCAKFAGFLPAGEPRFAAAEICSYADFFAGKFADHDRSRADAQERMP